MAHRSAAPFRTLHALRIKGFAKADVLAELADLPIEEVEAHLADLQARELAVFREARALWQLTPAGRDVHAELLAADLEGFDVELLKRPYVEFLQQNDALKVVCEDWQLRDGAPNDHSDDVYDKDVVERLVALDATARPIVASMGALMGRLSAYGPRLERACRKVVEGETKMLTGVMCGSYHDVWMELHEDLILTQRVDRTEEGSY